MDALSRHSLIAVCLVTFVTAGNNFQREKQFRAIEEKEVEVCVLIRNGIKIETTAAEVVVGDIIVLKQGDIIVADGIFVSGSGLLFISFFVALLSSPPFSTST